MIQQTIVSEMKKRIDAEIARGGLKQMDKETVKKIINDFIDSVDEVQDFSITNDVEEIDNSTLDSKDIIRIPTGLTNVYITTYKRCDQMETALRSKLVQEIPELVDQIYPTNAPEGHTKPYLVYARISTNKVKTLDGYTGTEHLSYMFSIMATRYGDMKRITKKVEKLLESLPKTTIGGFFIEDIDINNVHEVYEHELKVNRGIIDFTIYYQKGGIKYGRRSKKSHKGVRYGP